MTYFVISLTSNNSMEDEISDVLIVGLIKMYLKCYSVSKGVFETSVTIYNSTRLYIPGDLNLLHGRGKNDTGSTVYRVLKLCTVIYRGIILSGQYRLSFPVDSFIV